MSYFIFFFAITYIAFTIIHEIHKGIKNDSWRKTHSSKQTRRYIKEKIQITNKYCSDLPQFDSRGIFSGVSGSFTDRTGKFDPSYTKEMEDLENKYNE